MAVKIPLIIEDGQIKQLQEGDTLPGLDQLEGWYVTLNTNQEIMGQKQFDQDVILREGQRIVFDGK